MSSKASKIKSLWLPAVLSLGLTLLLFILNLTNYFSSVNSKLVNQLYDYNSNSSEVIIIAIDDKSTEVNGESLGPLMRWSRINYSKLLNKLKDENPNSIAFDIIFNENISYLKKEDLTFLKSAQSLPQTDNFNIDANNFEYFLYLLDQDFIESTQDFTNIIFASLIGGNAELILPIPELIQGNKIGLINIADSGVVRRFDPTLSTTYQDQIITLDHLSIATAKQYLDALPIQDGDVTEDLYRIRTPEGNIDIPLEDGGMMINYFGDPFSYKMISFVDVVNGNFEPGTFKDKIVLVGVTSFKEIQDKVLTPRSERTAMAGIEVHANIIQTILDQKFLVNQSGFSRFITMFVICFTLALILSYVGVLWSIVIGIGYIVGFNLFSHFMYRNGVILHLFGPYLAIGLTYLGSWVYRYFVTDKNKRQLTGAFSKYVSKDLVEEITKNPEIVKLGGEKKVVTVFFSDIKDSTALSEKVQIENWVHQINEYFTEMEELIMKTGGTVDKYEGDAIMAFWNAPIPQENHIFRAYLAAITMKKALERLHKKWEREGRPLLEFRIGINTGEALVGNLGSTNRLDYTVMGDTVNTASRLESSANKTYETSIIVTGFEDFGKSEKMKELPANNMASTTENSTKNLPSGLEKFVFRELDTVLLPGKKEPVVIYELVGIKGEVSGETLETLKIYAQGLAAYRVRNFEAALDLFSKISDKDKPARVMQERISRLVKGENIPELKDRMVFQILHK